jgi:hypothetical protein
VKGGARRDARGRDQKIRGLVVGRGIWSENLGGDGDLFSSGAKTKNLSVHGVAEIVTATYADTTTCYPAPSSASSTSSYVSVTLTDVADYSYAPHPAYVSVSSPSPQSPPVASVVSSDPSYNFHTPSVPAS